MALLLRLHYRNMTIASTKAAAKNIKCAVLHSLISTLAVNASCGYLNPFGIETFTKLDQPPNASFPIEMTNTGIVADTNALQPKNALWSMKMTESEW